MTNREFYKEQILDVVCSGKNFCVDKTNNIVACNEIGCNNCLFNHKECVPATEEWCNAEYIEPHPFEKGELVEVSEDGADWSLRYFSHMKNGIYCVFLKGEKSGDIISWKYCRKYGTLGGLVKE